MNRLRLQQVARWVSFTFCATTASSAWGAGVEILSPRQGDLVGGSDISCVAQFSSRTRGITRLEFLVDGHALAEQPYVPPVRRASATFVWDSNGVPTGDHHLSVRALAGDVTVGEDNVAVDVANGGPDIVPPQVFIYYPRPGDVLSGKREIGIQASDNVGVSMVTLFIDHQLKLIQNVAPFQYTWDTTLYPNGPHMLEVWAYDAAQNKGESGQILVRVNNPTGRTDIEETPATGSEAAPDQARPATPPSPTTVVVPRNRPARMPSASRGHALRVLSGPLSAAHHRLPALSQPSAPVGKALVARLDAAGLEAMPDSLAAPRAAFPTTPRSAIARALPRARPQGRAFVAGADLGEAAATAVPAAAHAAAPATRRVHPRVSAPPATSGPSSARRLLGTLPVRHVVSARHSEPVRVAMLDIRDSIPAMAAMAAPFKPALGSARTATRHRSSVPRAAALIARAEPKETPFLGSASPQNSGARPFTLRNPTGRLGVVLDSQRLRFDVAPELSRGIAMAPFRSIMEHAGGVVVWAPASRSVLASRRNETIRLKIGSRQAFVNEQPVWLQHAAFLKTGRTMVPIRFVQVALGLNLMFDPGRNLVYLYRK